MYDIEFSETARKQFHKLERSIQEIIGSALERIRIRPEAYVVRLVGEPYYKFRVGDYRLIIDVQHSRLIIFVVEVGHRGNIYEK